MSRISKRISKILITGALAMAAIAPIASARPQVFVRGYVGPAYYGPAYGWYGPVWRPYGYGYVPVAPYGSLKFEHTLKVTSVFVDGGFAGTVGQLKTFKLHPGTHNIELRTPDGHTFYQERLDIIAGRTLKITP
jgi:hypothetical protein